MSGWTRFTCQFFIVKSNLLWTREKSVFWKKHHTAKDGHELNHSRSKSFSLIINYMYHISLFDVYKGFHSCYEKDIYIIFNSFILTKFLNLLFQSLGKMIVCFWFIFLSFIITGRNTWKKKKTITNPCSTKTRLVPHNDRHLLSPYEINALSMNYGICLCTPVNPPDQKSV